MSKQAKDTLNKINNLKQEIDGIIKNNIKRSTKNMFKILDYIFKKPIVNADELIKNLNLNKMTTYNIIYKLESLNILQEISGRERNKVYRFGRYMDLFGEDGEV